MKTTCSAAVIFLSSLALLRAGSGFDVTTLQEQHPDREPVNSNNNKSNAADADPVGEDPNAVPEAFRHPERHRLSAAQRVEIEERTKKAAEDRNWLLRDYERQLRAHTQGQDSEINLYAELAGDKELAKVAGISPVDLNSLPEPQTESSPSPASSLRPDPALRPPPPSLETSPASLFQPLITPLASPEMIAATSPLATTSAPFLTPLISLDSGEAESDEPRVTLRPRASAPGVLDIPGMTAAKSSLSTRESMDLTTDDLLPGELPSEERPHHNLALDLPPDTDAERLQKLQDTALTLPGQTPKKALPVHPLVLVPPPTATQEMVPDPGPLRSHVADPFDMLR